MFDPVNGAQRTAIPAATAEQLQRAGVLVPDHRRSRPLWFDGRFLAARDLNREQDYFLTRQADLAEAAGTGVAEGLLVEAGATATQLRISPGHGVASGGARVEIPPIDASAGTGGDLVIDLAEIATQRQLNVAIGQGGDPAVPDRVRSGLFIVALRPIEYSGNALGRYPTQPGEVRGLQDGETIEAALVTLLPLGERATHSDDHLRRSAVARRLFLDGDGWRAPSNALPLAVVRLERNQVRWVDPWLVRRPLGDARSDALGLGLAPRPARLAFLRQFQMQLAEVIAERQARGATLRFPASDHFTVLPPAGPLPVQAISDAGDTLVQHWFPSAMDVDIAVVPSDELATVLEESFLLPPIPLDATADDLAATGVLVLLPVSRSELRGITKRPVAMRRPVPAAGASDNLLRGGTAGRTWQALADLNLRMTARAKAASKWLGTSATIGEAGAALDVTRDAVDGTTEDQLGMPLARWRTLLAGAQSLWYVRRRNLAFKETMVGSGREVIPDEATAEEALGVWLKDAKLTKLYGDVTTKATSAGRQRVFSLLNAKMKAGDDLGARMVLTAVHDAGRFDEASINAAAGVYADERTSAAIKRVLDEVLEAEIKPDGTPIPAVIERNRTLRAKLADPKTVEDLRHIGTVSSPTQLDTIAGTLKGSLKSESREKLQAKISDLRSTV